MGTNFPICCAPDGFAVQAMPTAKRRAPTSTFYRRMDASQANLVRGRLQMQFAQILAPPAPQRKQIRDSDCRARSLVLGELHAPISAPSVLNPSFPRLRLKTRSRPLQNKNANASGSQD